MISTPPRFYIYQDIISLEMGYFMGYIIFFRGVEILKDREYKREAHNKSLILIY